MTWGWEGGQWNKHCRFLILLFFHLYLLTSMRRLHPTCTAHKITDLGETCIPLRSQLYARRGAKAAIATPPKCTFPASRHHMVWVNCASVVPWRSERTVNSVSFIETDLFPAEGRRDASRWTERLFWWEGNLRPLNVSTSPGCSEKKPWGGGRQKPSLWAANEGNGLNSPVTVVAIVKGVGRKSDSVKSNYATSWADKMLQLSNSSIHFYLLCTFIKSYSLVVASWHNLWPDRGRSSSSLPVTIACL